MLYKKTIKIATLNIILFLSGCATIVGGGSTQQVNFDSKPQGAKILVGKQGKNGEITDLLDTGQVTPSFVVLERSKAVVILQKEGYEDIQVALTKTTNGWFFGNFFIGGLLGSSIDSSTGAINKYDPNHFFVDFEKNISTPVEEEKSNKKNESEDSAESQQT